MIHFMSFVIEIFDGLYIEDKINPIVITTLKKKLKNIINENIGISE
jgi:hypothetical protein